MTLKEKIVESINSVNDEGVLSYIEEILELKKIEKHSIELNQDQKDSISQGLDDIDQGRVLSNKDANYQVEKWLEE